MVSTVTFPNFSAAWPFQRTLNAHYESAALASAQWVETFHILDDRSQAVFNRCKFSLLASLTFPHADPAHLRLACDLVNWFFLFDQVSDAMDGPAARDLARRLIDILRDPLKPRPAHTTSLEAMTANFWSRCLATACATSAKRFARSMELYIDSVWREAEDRVSGRMRSIDEYLALRRETAGIQPSCDFLLLTTDIPDKVLGHPRVNSLTRIAVDLMIILNDVYSWNYERARGLDNHNLVSAVLAEKGLDPQGAIDFIGEWYRSLARHFVAGMRSIPCFSSPALDAAVAVYVSGLGSAVTGYHEWAFESERYFGTRGAEVKESGVVELLSRKAGP